jgi:hypothetical protein
VVTDGVQMIADERQRQIEVEGWDAEHDRGQADEIASAGACYALPPVVREDTRIPFNSPTPLLWPWDDKWWKPTPGDRIRELVKAGALIAAAIDSMLDAGYVTQLPGQEDLGLG